MTTNIPPRARSRKTARPAVEPARRDSSPEDLGFELPRAASFSKKKLAVVGLVALGVLGAAFAVRYVPKRQARAELEAAAKQGESKKPRVQVTAPKAIASDRAITLPASVQALEETTVNPRASGYVSKWHVDIGDEVDEGQLLIEIDTPELDQQVTQARARVTQAQAAVVQAEANAEYSVGAAKRGKLLLAEGLASDQDAEKLASQQRVDAAAIGVAKANLAAMAADVARLTDLKSFARITAPFAGRVTARNVERGALVNGMGTSATAPPLLKIAITDPVRVFVQVPQESASGVRLDAPATVTVREHAGRKFEGKVARFAGALDPATRTMTTEVRVPNPKGELVVGTFAQVAMTLPTPHVVYELPATAILQDAAGIRVAIVDASSKIKLVPVVIERDTGATVEIGSGLGPGDRVVKLVNAELTEGREVEVAP